MPIFSFSALHCDRASRRAWLLVECRFLGGWVGRKGHLAFMPASHVSLLRKLLMHNWPFLAPRILSWRHRVLLGFVITFFLVIFRRWYGFFGWYDDFLVYFGFLFLNKLSELSLFVDFFEMMLVDPGWGMMADRFLRFSGSIVSLRIEVTWIL